MSKEIVINNCLIDMHATKFTMTAAPWSSSKDPSTVYRSCFHGNHILNRFYIIYQRGNDYVIVRHIIKPLTEKVITIVCCV